MKGKLFYDHLIIIEEISVITGNDKKLLDLVDTWMQHEVLDVIFSFLPAEKHDEFLKKFHANPANTKLLDYLKQHSAINIELAILDRANKTKRKILKEIKKHGTI